MERRTIFERKRWMGMRERYALRIVFVLLFVAPVAMGTALGQYFRKSNYWKTHRNELSIGMGAANFLGELGGRNQIGSPFIWDLEFSQTRPAVSLGYRYYFFEKQSVRFNLTYGVLAGNDNLTTEKFRRNRNLSFRSDVVEFAIVYELHTFREELGHIYDLRGVKGQKAWRIGMYGFIGIGGFYFDPRAKYNNAWVRLKPLTTEGQGLPGGPEQYSNFSFCIPMGLGLRKALNQRWSVGLELQYSLTFTDYIDDVSTIYYDEEVLRENHGEIGAYLANPSLNEGDYISDFTTSAGQQRGDASDKDAYLFLKIQLHHKLYKYKSGSKKYRSRIRRQKIIF
ncbi:MAG: hypothetical protein KDB88_01600 [Flavobacteriales bacterium]|nr:hypothetical protein [Flavobacteriales bacterium]